MGGGTEELYMDPCILIDHDTSKDSDGDDNVPYSKFKPTGTNNDFDKNCHGW